MNKTRNGVDDGDNRNKVDKKQSEKSSNQDDENIIDGVEHLPKSWEEAWDMCKPILNKSRPDEIRLDFMYHDNQVYLNEFTWNPGCDFTQRNQTLSPQAYTLLTDGYEYILGGKRPRVKLSI